jgi:hypothetical protein
VAVLFGFALCVAFFSDNLFLKDAIILTSCGPASPAPGTSLRLRRSDFSGHAAFFGLGAYTPR